MDNRQPHKPYQYPSGHFSSSTPVRLDTPVMSAPYTSNGALAGAPSPHLHPLAINPPQQSLASRQAWLQHVPNTHIVSQGSRSQPRDHLGYDQVHPTMRMSHIQHPEPNSPGSLRTPALSRAQDELYHQNMRTMTAMLRNQHGSHVSLSQQSQSPGQQLLYATGYPFLQKSMSPPMDLPAYHSPARRDSAMPSPDEFPKQQNQQQHSGKSAQTQIQQNKPAAIPRLQRDLTNTSDISQHRSSSKSTPSSVTGREKLVPRAPSSQVSRPSLAATHPSQYQRPPIKMAEERSLARRDSFTSAPRAPPAVDPLRSFVPPLDAENFRKRRRSSPVAQDDLQKNTAQSNTSKRSVESQAPASSLFDVASPQPHFTPPLPSSPPLRRSSADSTESQWTAKRPKLVDPMLQTKSSPRPTMPSLKGRGLLGPECKGAGVVLSPTWMVGLPFGGVIELANNYPDDGAQRPSGAR